MLAEIEVSAADAETVIGFTVIATEFKIAGSLLEVAVITAGVQLAVTYVAVVGNIFESAPQLLGIDQVTPSGSLVAAVRATCAPSPTVPDGLAETDVMLGAPTVKITEADLLVSGTAVAVTVAVHVPVAVEDGV
jgi:hypothetical protein